MSMKKMMSMAALTLAFCAQAQAAESFGCKITETAGAPPNEPAMNWTVTVDNGKAVISFQDQKVNCDAITDEKTLTDAAKEMKDGFGLILTAKLLLTCKGQTFDETTNLLLTKDPVPKSNINALWLSPVVGFLGVGTCDQK